MSAPSRRASMAVILTALTASLASITPARRRSSGVGFFFAETELSAPPFNGKRRSRGFRRSSILTSYCSRYFLKRPPLGSLNLLYSKIGCELLLTSDITRDNIHLSLFFLSKRLTPPGMIRARNNFLA